MLTCGVVGSVVLQRYVEEWRRKIWGGVGRPARPEGWARFSTASRRSRELRTANCERTSNACLLTCKAYELSISEANGRTY